MRKILVAFGGLLVIGTVSMTQVGSAALSPPQPAQIEDACYCIWTPFGCIPLVDVNHNSDPSHGGSQSPSSQPLGPDLLA